MAILNFYLLSLLFAPDILNLYQLALFIKTLLD